MLNSNKTPDIFGGGLQADFVAEKRAPMPAAREREDSRRALRGAAALGTITKYPATGMGAGSGATSSIAESGKIEVIDPETGEITAFERSGSGAFVQAKRSFEDGRQARYSLHRAFKQIEPKHRTAQCLWSVVSAEKPFKSCWIRSTTGRGTTTCACAGACGPVRFALPRSQNGVRLNWPERWR